MTWEQFWESVSVAQAAAWVVAIAVLVGVAVRLYKPLRAFFRALDQFLTLADDITYIREQLTDNGGTTVKDAAQQTARMTAENAVAIGRIEKKVDAATTVARQAKAAAAATQKLVIDHVKTMNEEK